MVQPKATEEKATEPPNAVHVSYDQLRVVETGAYKPATRPISTSPAAPPPVTGGPSTRAIRQ